jgi:Xaa-Pro dipeptidase
MHALGHQVGRMAHDGGAVLAPRWQRYCRSPYMQVESGQVYTLELGVVVEGRGYLGLEEMVLVTESGIDWLSSRQTGMPLLP